MATRAYQGGASALPDLAAMLAAIPSLPRPVLARLTARLIDRMDEMDPDPDLEPDGDEEDGTNAEDEALCLPPWHSMPIGPGCPYAEGGGL